MTAVARISDLPPQSAAAVAVDWSKELEGAKLLLSSGLLPQSIKTAQQALYVILTGRDLGLSPVQSLRSINVIQGKIEVAADMQLALFKRHGGRAEFRTLTDAAAVLHLQHANGDQHTETFTMEDAKRAGLAGDNWRKYPRAMLRSRVITAGLKSVGFDVLAGAYAEGEIGGPEAALTVEAEAVTTDQAAPDSPGGMANTLRESLPAVAPQTAPALVPGDNPPTERQVAFYRNLAGSPVFSDEEREQFLGWLEGPYCNRQSIKEKLTDLKTRVEKGAAK